ncbi:hypothetical protein ACEZDB_36520 [Streptacidiphilus sp. N1-3]|uniref:Uncharacterized protein n=1 Tax=Streptacidiphilus alkalitolerans TaxID=3342712 RepID=A0ABV6XDK8_9ACTN
MDQAAAQADGHGDDVTFTDPAAQFAGKGVCGSPEDINGIVLSTTYSDNPSFNFPLLGSYGLSAQSFHPKIEGAFLYALALEGTLSSM